MNLILFGLTSVFVLYTTFRTCCVAHMWSCWPCPTQASGRCCIRHGRGEEPLEAAERTFCCGCRDRLQSLWGCEGALPPAGDSVADRHWRAS